MIAVLGQQTPGHRITTNIMVCINTALQQAGDAEHELEPFMYEALEDKLWEVRCTWDLPTAPVVSDSPPVVMAEMVTVTAFEPRGLAVKLPQAQCCCDVTRHVSAQLRDGLQWGSVRWQLMQTQRPSDSSPTTDSGTDQTVILAVGSAALRPLLAITAAQREVVLEQRVTVVAAVAAAAGDADTADEPAVMANVTLKASLH
jgi:hypothetical protein